AFKQMLASPMREGQDKRVELKGFSGTQLNFLMRLLYTGQVHSSDWDNVTAPGLPRGPECDSEDPEKRPTGRRDKRSSSNPRMGSWRSRRLSPSPLNSSDEESIAEPPLQFLLAACSFAKTYQIRGGLCAQMVSKIKKRVRSDVTAYEAVVRFAIREDVGPLRLFCVHFAKESAAIRRRFEKGDLPPEVTFELQAIWEAPRKKRKFF
ncbi:unnamed protein product, partial [Polarella glacialis]